MNEFYWFEPTLYDFIKKAITNINKSKKDVFDFFKTAGVEEKIIIDLENQINKDSNSMYKEQVCDDILYKINDKSNKYKVQRVEIIRKIVEFKDFDRCNVDEEQFAREYVKDVINYLKFLENKLKTENK
ncbi:MAG: hypothetical protein Q8880_07220 [Bacteroidota bacterium]|nr:hypothetical protein [Bacteroidota bacterium]